ncbi:UvrB/UvrC motif-containing protein [Christensenellaceae bacterium 44-20]
MLCNECGKNQATVHSVQYINGAKSEVHLCAECAKHHPELNMNLFSTGDFFKSFFDDFMQLPVHSGQGAVCQSCGTSFRDFQQSGLFGCPDCYDTFRDAVIPVLKGAHGSVQHIGEKPAASKEEAEKRRHYYELKEQLSKAIAEENFEKAAELRDEMKAMKIQGEEK